MEFNTLVNSPKKHPFPKVAISISWTPPPINVIRLNVDGAVLANPGRGGVGGVFRDSNGSWVLGFMKACAHTTPLQAELLAILHGLRLANERNYTPLEVHTDSATSVSIISNSHACFTNLISECRYLLKKLRPTTLKHVFREENGVADAIAKEAARVAYFDDVKTFSGVPALDMKEMESDARNTPVIRKISTHFVNSTAFAPTSLSVMGTNPGLEPGPA